MDKQQQLDQLFRLAQQDPMVQSFGQTKDRFVSAVNAVSVNKPKTKQVFTKKWIIMLTTVSTISLSLFLLWNKEETTKAKQADETTINQSVPENQTISDPQNPEPEQKQVVKAAPFLAVIQELVTELPLSNENEAAGGIENPKDRKLSDFKPLDDTPYQFPFLTEEEIALTKKKKKAMLKALVKHDKSAYAYIPSGTFDYNGKQVSVQAFYMGIGEVTNFEYRTFLFDLIIQGRKDEFLKAKPDQTAWSKELNGGKPYQEHYFSHKAYNDFPVVNVSREGAELYCKWLSEEVRKYVGDQNEGKYNDVRLPLRVEWVKAASNEGKQLPYPWKGPFVRHSTGAFEGAFQSNFVHGVVDTIFETTTSSTVGGDLLAPSKSFWPSELGLYNMSGNAAEMVYEGMNRTDPGTAGGSWMSFENEIKIYAPDPNKGVITAKPTIGFRVVSTYLNK